MRACLPASALLALGVLGQGYGQEKARKFCDEADPASKCPGDNCRCAPDTLEITFDGRGRSILHAGDLEPGATIAVTVVLDTRSAQLIGWSYGVAHDESVLKLLSVTTQGTDYKMVVRNDFDATSMEKIQRCVDDDPRCANVRDGGGWISATPLHVGDYVELPVKRNSLAVAQYTLLERPGPEGTTIELTDRLKKVGSPPVSIGLTVSGRSKVPTMLIDGFITPEAPPAAGPFLRGDANGDGRIHVTDAIAILHAVLSREDLACEDALDTDDSGNIDFVDGLVLLRFLFDRGTAGAIGICGRDLTDDSLGCSTACSG
jgi:hypothetical protein